MKKGDGKSEQLRVFIITQNEPFYLASAMKYLLCNLPVDVSIVGAYVLEGSPFGRKKSFIQKARDTVIIFGFRFFAFYSWRFLISKLFYKDVSAVLRSEVNFVRSGLIDINSEKNCSEIKQYRPDVIISVASNQIFRKPLLDLPTLACLNLHTAKLPKYRGLMPLFWAMANGDKEIGVTVFEMDEGVDSGPIVQQSILQIADYSMHALIIKTKYLGMTLLVRALENYLQGDVTYIPNDDNEATQVKFPTKKDAKRFKTTGRRYF